MAKLNYVEGDYKEALNIYARGGLDDLPLTAVPPYRLRLIAEAYATKGEPEPSLPRGCPRGHAALRGACRPTRALDWQSPARPRGGAHHVHCIVQAQPHSASSEPLVCSSHQNKERPNTERVLITNLQGKQGFMG